MTVSTFGISAHRSPGPVSFLEESAHRLNSSSISEARQLAPSPWPHQLGLDETQATELLALMPKWVAIAREWWDPRPRITITVRARLMGGVRVYRFWRATSARRRVERFLTAHRRIYRLYAQPAAAPRSGAV